MCFRIGSRKSSISMPIEMMSLSGDMSSVEVKSRKKRKHRKIKWGNASHEWAKSLLKRQLDLMMSVKQLAIERVRSRKITQWALDFC